MRLLPCHRVPDVPLALFAVLLAAGCAGTQPTADPDDLALIPADARGFLSVRVADLWNTPRIQKGVGDARARDFKIKGPAVHMDKAFGLKPDEVERVSAV